MARGTTVDAFADIAVTVQFAVGCGTAAVGGVMSEIIFKQFLAEA